jgi:hypothetical protein
MITRSRGRKDVLCVRLKGGGTVWLGCGPAMVTKTDKGRVTAMEVGFPPRSWKTYLRSAGLGPGPTYEGVPIRLIAECMVRSRGLKEEVGAELFPPLDITLAECLGKGWVFFMTRAK